MDLQLALTLFGNVLQQGGRAVVPLDITAVALSCAGVVHHDDMTGQISLQHNGITGGQGSGGEYRMGVIQLNGHIGNGFIRIQQNHIAVFLGDDLCDLAELLRIAIAQRLDVQLAGCGSLLHREVVAFDNADQVGVGDIDRTMRWRWCRDGNRN